jgi:hypothetical protein
LAGAIATGVARLGPRPVAHVSFIAMRPRMIEIVAAAALVVVLAGMVVVIVLATIPGGGAPTLK